MTRLSQACDKVAGTLQPLPQHCYFCMGELLHKKGLLYAELEITAGHSHFPANSCPCKTHFGRCPGKTRILACAQFISNYLLSIIYIINPLSLDYRHCYTDLIHSETSCQNSLWLDKFYQINLISASDTTVIHYQDSKFQD